MKRYQVKSIELDEVICYGEYDSYDEAHEEYVKLGGFEYETLWIEEIDDMDLEEERQMRVYISGPITGTTDFRERFAAAETQLQMQGYDVFNPARVSQGMPEAATWEDYMKVSEAVLSCCDTIYMLPGWENSRGAVKEYHLAMAAGMVVLKEGA